MGVLDWVGNLIDDSNSGGFWSDLGSWLGDAAGNLGDWLGDSDNLSGILTLLGSGALANSSFVSPNIDKVGYQGGIPDYTAVRERLPGPAEPAVMPPSGSVAPTMGRRYFTDTEYQLNAPKLEAPQLAQGGIVALRHGGPSYRAQSIRNPRKQGVVGLISGKTDGLADRVPAKIRGGSKPQKAVLSDGEFVVPADVVSHLGNGNTQAGAEVLYNMMDRIRAERTGSMEPSEKINPKQVLPA